jgi:hypothetical protein
MARTPLVSSSSANPNYPLQNALDDRKRYGNTALKADIKLEPRCPDLFDDSLKDYIYTKSHLC